MTLPPLLIFPHSHLALPPTRSAFLSNFICCLYRTILDRFEDPVSRLSRTWAFKRLTVLAITRGDTPSTFGRPTTRFQLARQALQKRDRIETGHLGRPVMAVKDDGASVPTSWLSLVRVADRSSSFYPTETIISKRGRRHYKVPVRSQCVHASYSITKKMHTGLGD